MNLMEVQSRLNKLPPLPESIQYLTAAAQGGNAQVPPFMALARISEINKEIQTSQQPQPPAEPLNESLPKQALQSMGIGALQQGRQQQGMQQMAQQAGATQQAAPPGIPQPVRQQQPQPQQQMPQQGAQPVRMAADGGLMSIPVDPSMFEYGSGGVVAFANPEGEQLVKDETVAEEAAVEDEPGYDAEAELKKLMPQIQKLMQQQVRPIRSKETIEKGLTKDYGVDEGPIGKNYLAGLASLKEAKAVEDARKQTDIDERKKFATRKALLDYSDATRGQTGLGGIGALARSSMGSAEKFMGEEAGLRENAIKRDELMNEAQYKFQGLRQAQKDGDIKAEQKNDLDLSKIAKDLGVSKNNLMARLVTGNLNLMGKYETAQASRDVAATRAAAKNAAGSKTPRETDQQRGVRAIAAGLKEKFPDMSDAEIEALATNLYRQSATAPAVAGRERKDINEDWRKEKYQPSYLDAKDKEAYEREWRRKWREANPDAAPAAAPAPAPAAAPAPAPAPAPAAKLTKEQNNEAIAKANEAIKNGADPEKVKARLKAAGVRFEGDGK
jgi:hypothetical protein